MEEIGRVVEGPSERVDGATGDGKEGLQKMQSMQKAIYQQAKCAQEESVRTATSRGGVVVVLSLSRSGRNIFYTLILVT